MPDIGEKATEREYKRLRAKIRDVYQQAYEEIYQKNLDFVRRHEQKERQYRQMVAEGRISQADFDAWMRGQVFQGRMWEAQRKQMQETLYHADEIALQMVNDSRYSVFADNANYIGYTLEKGARVMTSFGLYDADSVRRLIKDEPYLLPPRKLAGRDKSYQWYNRQIQTAITQGIIQGEPLKDIAKRIGQQTGETDMNAMLRNARTMQTGAQNAGRIEGMHQAQRLGINVKKQWMATLDSHTRDAHQALDGQIAEVDKPFKSELGPIMYPGDQAASPANVWNCRCTLVSVYPEYPDEMMKRRDNETGEIIDNMTYREWEAAKKGTIPQTPVVKPSPTAVEDTFTIPDSMRQEITPDSASEDWFEYEYANAMREYIETGNMPTVDINGEKIDLETRQRLAAEAELMQNIGATTKTEYKTLYRGMVLDEDDARSMFTPGETFTFETLSAATPDKGIAGIFMNPENMGGEGVPVILEIQKGDGIYGFKRDDAETVIPKGSEFRVVRNWMDENWVVHISLYAKKGKNVG